MTGKHESHYARVRNQGTALFFSHWHDNGNQDSGEVRSNLAG